MATYVRVGAPRGATGLAALTGEDHPLGDQPTVPERIRSEPTRTK